MPIKSYRVVNPGPRRVKVAGDPRYKVLIVQKSDTRLHGGLLGDEKKKKKF
jgi:hypothetical protein